MKQRLRSNADSASLSPEEVAAIVRRAYAERDAAIGRALGALLRRLAAALDGFHRAVDQAYRLRALASLSDRQLSMLGMARADLPGIVYGWTSEGGPAEPLIPGDLAGRALSTRHREAA